MTDDQRQKWAEINAFINPPKAAELPPVPSGCPNPTALDAETRERLFDNWIDYIGSKRPETWTSEEKGAWRFAIDRALKGLK